MIMKILEFCDFVVNSSNEKIVIDKENILISINTTNNVYRRYRKYIMGTVENPFNIGKIFKIIEPDRILSKYN